MGRPAGIDLRDLRPVNGTDAEIARVEIAAGRRRDAHGEALGASHRHNLEFTPGSGKHGELERVPGCHVGAVDARNSVAHAQAGAFGGASGGHGANHHRRRLVERHLRALAQDAGGHDEGQQNVHDGACGVDLEAHPLALGHELVGGHGPPPFDVLASQFHVAAERHEADAVFRVLTDHLDEFRTET